MIRILLILLILIIFIIAYTATTNHYTENLIAENQMIQKQWPCETCGPTGQAVDTTLLPSYQYLLSDSRCIQAKDMNTFLPKSDTQLFNDYKNTKVSKINTNTVSCYSDYDSRYSDVTGRYIRIYCPNNMPLVLNHISVYDKFNTLLSSSAFIYCNMPLTRSVDTILNSNADTTENFVSQPGAYIQLDLTSNTKIAYVKIAYKPSPDVNLYYKWLMILREQPMLNGKPQLPVVVFNSMVPDKTNSDIVRTQNFVEITKYPDVTDPIKTFSYPCTNCMTADGKLIRGYKYNKMIDGRPHCLKPKINLRPEMLERHEVNLNQFENCGPNTLFPSASNPWWLIDTSDPTNMVVNELNQVVSINMVSENNRVLYKFEPHLNAYGGAVTAPSSNIRYVTSPNKAIITDSLSDKALAVSAAIGPNVGLTYYCVGQLAEMGWLAPYSVSAGDKDGHSFNLFVYNRGNNSAGLTTVTDGHVEIGSRVEDSTTLPLVANNLHIITWNIQPNFQAQYVNGSEITGSPYNNTLTMGWSSTSLWSSIGFNYKLSEIRVYHASHSNAQVATIVASLKAKWNITQW